MSVLRKLSAVELSGVTTFGSLCGSLLKTVQSYASKSREIHLVLENYKDKSAQSTERPRRATELGPLFDILSDDQPLPDMKKFFSRMEALSCSLLYKDIHILSAVIHCWRGF